MLRLICPRDIFLHLGPELLCVGTEYFSLYWEVMKERVVMKGKPLD